MRGSHWADPKVFAERAYYHAHWTPPALELSYVRPSDARIYRCRVDYNHSNSRVGRVRLLVIGKSDFIYV